MKAAPRPRHGRARPDRIMGREKIEINRKICRGKKSFAHTHQMRPTHKAGRTAKKGTELCKEGKNG